MDIIRLFFSILFLIFFQPLGLLIWLYWFRWIPTNSLWDSLPRMLSSFLNNKVYFLDILQQYAAQSMIILSHKIQKVIIFFNQMLNFFWNEYVQVKRPNLWKPNKPHLLQTHETILPLNDAIINSANFLSKERWSDSRSNSQTNTSTCAKNAQNDSNKRNTASTAGRYILTPMKSMVTSG